MSPSKDKPKFNSLSKKEQKEQICEYINCLGNKSIWTGDNETWDLFENNKKKAEELMTDDNFLKANHSILIEFNFKF